MRGLCLASGGQLWLPGYSPSNDWLGVGVSALPPSPAPLVSALSAAVDADGSHDGFSLPGSSLLSLLLVFTISFRCVLAWKMGWKEEGYSCDPVFILGWGYMWNHLNL